MGKRSVWATIGAGIFMILLMSANLEECSKDDRQVEMLSGEWQLYAGSNPGAYKYKVQVPGLVDLAKPKLDWKKYPYFYYRRTFTPTEDHLKYSRAWLRINGAFWGAKVWINGQPVGMSWRCFAPIELEVRQFLKPGENEIIVRVGTYKSVPPDKILIGYDEEKTDYIPGLWGDVGIYFSQDQRIRNVLLMPDPDHEQVVAKVFAQNLAAENKKLTLKCEVKDSSTVSQQIELPANSEKEFLVPIAIKNPKLWSPEHPDLYSFEARLYEAKTYSAKEIIDLHKNCLTKVRKDRADCPLLIVDVQNDCREQAKNQAKKEKENSDSHAKCLADVHNAPADCEKRFAEDKARQEKEKADCYLALNDPVGACNDYEKEMAGDCETEFTEHQKDPAYMDELDMFQDSFGMRKFEIRNGDFYLNDKHVRLFGSNIAFQRWLSDPERRGLAWDDDFIKKILVDIPKAHNMNFFRNHVGPLYNKWYEAADRGGILLQDEYFLWGGPTRNAGHYHPDTKIWWDEYRAWMESRWNHPSIIIYDLENESPKDMIAFLNKEIAPQVRALDPTRPIEPLDFSEDHPYQWSLSGVVNTRWMGGKDIPTSRPFAELSRKDTPIVVNEFPWFWLDNMGRPTKTTYEVLKRWLGPDAYEASPDKLLKYQAWLTRELVELYRRTDVDAIQPFVYLANNNGTTGNYFLGPIDQLIPKPVLAELKEAYKPQACSLELWDRHFFPGETRRLKVYVFNDDPDHEFTGKVVANLNSWSETRDVKLAPAEHKVIEFDYLFMHQESNLDSDAMATLKDAEGKEIYTSTKQVQISAAPGLPDEIKYKQVCGLDPAGEASAYLEKTGAKYSRLDFKKPIPAECMAVLVAPGAVQDHSYKYFRPHLFAYLLGGGGAVVLEPEFGATTEKYVQLVLPGGGVPMLYANTYKFIGEDIPGKDSVVWPTDEAAAGRVFKDIGEDELYFFNGGLGEEMVSELVAFPLKPGKTLAKSSIWLMKPVMFEYRVGKGVLVVSRVQVRGRLLGEEQKDIWSRRADPVAQKLFLNLLLEAYEQGEGKQ